MTYRVFKIQVQRSAAGNRSFAGGHFHIGNGSAGCHTTRTTYEFPPSGIGRKYLGAPIWTSSSEMDPISKTVTTNSQQRRGSARGLVLGLT